MPTHKHSLQIYLFIVKWHQIQHIRRFYEFKNQSKCTIYFCRSCGVTSSKDIPQQDYRCAAKLVVYLLCEVCTCVSTFELSIQCHVRSRLHNAIFIFSVCYQVLITVAVSKTRRKFSYNLMVFFYKSAKY